MPLPIVDSDEPSGGPLAGGAEEQLGEAIAQRINTVPGAGSGGGAGAAASGGGAAGASRQGGSGSQHSAAPTLPPGESSAVTNLAWTK